MKDKYEELNKMLNMHAMASRPSECWKPVPIPKTTAPKPPVAPKPPKAPPLPKSPQQKAQDKIERERAKTGPSDSNFLGPSGKV